MTTITEQSFPVSATSLSDIPITSSVPTDGQALVYSAAANQFQYQSVGPTSVQLFKRIADPASGQQEIVYNALGGAAATDNLLVGPQTTAGANTKLLFVNNNTTALGAFRAGTVAGTQWDLANCGVGSFAGGIDTTAKGSGSFAMGNNVTANGSTSVCFGAVNSVLAQNCSILGGTQHNITAVGTNSVICGGEKNTINQSATGNANCISGGNLNTIGPATCVDCMIGCGNNNTINNCTSSAIIGGNSNTVLNASQSFVTGVNINMSGDNSVAMGKKINTSAMNTFTWSDGSTATPLTNATANSQLCLASGGYTYYSNAAQTAGSIMPAGGTWGPICDVNKKENLKELDYQTILQKLVDKIPVYQYNYKTNPIEQLCMGPTAQDWHAAFPSCKDKLMIESMDLEGVALAAIKGLARTVTNELDDIKLDIKMIKEHLSLV